MQFLQEQGVEHPKDFELHIPMLFNRNKLSEVVYNYRDWTEYLPLLRRTLYGNLAGVEATFRNDCKYVGRTDRAQGGPFASTIDDAFYHGRTGVQIRGLFPDKSPYER